jgi:hypothetical protein
MKRSLLLLGSMFALCSLGNAQTLVKYADFESFSPFMEGFGASTYEVVDNPSKTGINTSAKVAHTNHGDQTWSGLWAPVGGIVKFDASNLTFKMKVYSTIAGDVNFKFEYFDDSNINTGDVIAKYTTPNAWQELTFTFPATVPADLSKIVLFPGFGLTTREDWYFDDIEGVDFTPNAQYSAVVVVTNKTTETHTFKAKLGDKEVTLNDEGKDGDEKAADKKFSGTITGIDGTNIKSCTGKYKVSILVDGKENSQEDLNAWGSNSKLTINSIYSGAPLVDDGGKMSAGSTKTAPVIDGDVDAIWASQASHNQLNRLFKGTLELSSSFKMMWDANNLYILADVNDPTVATDWVAGTEWNFDNMEIFFDMDCNAGGAYDGVNDWQIRYNRGHEGNTVSGSANVSDDANYKAAQKEKADKSGYYMEWQIPFSALDVAFTAEANSKFGFCANTCDNTGTGRTDAVSWSATTDDAYQNTKSFGVVTLVDGPVGIKLNSNKAASVYPNPAKDVLFVANAGNVSNISISDLSGRQIISVSKADLAKGINVAALNAGMYLVSFTDAQGNKSSAKFIKK